MLKILRNLFIAAVVAYMGLIATLFIEQRHIMYTPDKRDSGPAQTVTPEMVETKILTPDGHYNESWFYLPENPKAKVIVMCHGNSSNVADRAVKARPFIDAGYGFVLVGYRGYGGNVGTPTEDGLYEDARAVMKYLVEERGVPVSNIVVYGESLGTGVATKMAAEYPDISGLVLEVPFDSALAVAQDRYWYIIGLSVLVRDQYRSDLRVPKLTMPKLVIAAGDDRVVPPIHARRLFEGAAEPKQFLEIPGGHHDNLYDYGLSDKIITFIGALP